MVILLWNVATSIQTDYTSVRHDCLFIGIIKINLSVFL